MAQAFTKGDSLGLYHTEKGTSTQVFTLGGRRSSFECGSPPVVKYPHPSIVVQQISGDLDEGSHFLSGDVDDLTLKASNSTVGSSVTCPLNSTVLVEDSDNNKWVRVYRDGDYNSDNLGGFSELQLRRTYRNILNIFTPTASTGSVGNFYSSFVLSNHSALSEEITNIKVWIGTLATQQVSDSAQLGATGSGTITTTGSFAGWRNSGWAHIKTSGGTTREIVYYESRTDTTLTIPSTGRGRLGTSAAAGAATDTIDSVPGFRFAGESPDSDGEIQEISSVSTAPTSVTWQTGITSATGLTISSLNKNDNHGIWIHNETPQSAVASLANKNVLHFEYTVGGITYNNRLTGYYDLAQTGLSSYELYVGVDTAPDTTATPDDTDSNTSFSLQYTATPPGAGTQDINFIVLDRNSYNLTSKGVYYDTITIDSTGNDVTSVVSAPENITLENYGGGIIRLKAKYRKSKDSTPATHWHIYSTTNGTDPDPTTDTPTSVSIGASSSVFSYSDSSYNLTYDFAAGDWDEDRRVLVRMYESVGDNESDNTTVSQINVSTTQVSVPPSQFIMGFSDKDLRGATGSPYSTADVSYGSGVATGNYLGQKSFYASGIIWRIFNKDENSGIIYIDGSYSFSNTAHSAAGTSDDIEVVSANEIYINVNSIRRAKINVTAGTIEADSFEFGAELDDIRVASDTYSNTTSTYIMCYDAGKGYFQPAIEVTSAGLMKFAHGVVQKRT